MINVQLQEEQILYTSMEKWYHWNKNFFRQSMDKRNGSYWKCFLPHIFFSSKTVVMYCIMLFIFQLMYITMVVNTGTISYSTKINYALLLKWQLLLRPLFHLSCHSLTLCCLSVWKNECLLCFLLHWALFSVHLFY